MKFQFRFNQIRSLDAKYGRSRISGTRHKSVDLMQKQRQKSFMKIINIFVAQLIRRSKAQVHCKKG